jgi:hypothetical protein
MMPPTPLKRGNPVITGLLVSQSHYYPALSERVLLHGISFIQPASSFSGHGMTWPDPCCSVLFCSVLLSHSVAPPSRERAGWSCRVSIIPKETIESPLEFSLAPRAFGQSSCFIQARQSGLCVVQQPSVSAFDIIQSSDTWRVGYTGKEEYDIKLAS